MDPFIGQIIMFGGNFAPRGWAFCNGQLLAINQYQALFSILGTTYGGDGRTSFGLPDMRSRVAVHAGNGPGLPTVRLGQKSGTATNTLTAANMPPLQGSVSIPATEEDPTTDDPNGNILAVSSIYAPANQANATLGSPIPFSLGGANQAVNNMPPYQAINYIIALQGTFPSRS